MLRNFLTVTPRRSLNRIEHEMENWMDRFFGGETWPVLRTTFMPTINVAETEASLEVTAEMPGLKPEDFHVEVKDGELWISGEKREEKEEKEKTFHRIERTYGEFRRVIPLPRTVDETKIEAHYKEGVLKVLVPKTEEAKPKRVEVKS